MGIEELSLEINQYVDGFRASLEQGAAAVAERYFLLPIAGGDSAYRERTYCYELYHQIKDHWPPVLVNSPFELGGEVDKAGHPRFQLPPLRAKKPDLLVHAPGDMDMNLVVVEVKSVSATRDEVETDLAKLTAFCTWAGYRRGFYLVFGYEKDEVVRIRAEGLASAQRNPGVGLANIDLYWHPGPLMAARRLTW